MEEGDLGAPNLLALIWLSPMEAAASVVKSEQLIGSRTLGAWPGSSSHVSIYLLLILGQVEPGDLRHDI